MHRSLISLSAAILLAATPGQHALAQPTVEVGILNCSVSGGTGFIVGSTKQLSCVFKSGKFQESYIGKISKFGVDLGSTSGGVITWAVFAPTNAKLGAGALSGSYGGVTGEATVGIGVGANALVGGSNRTIALQPLSVGAQQGLNLALGIAALTLEPGY